MYGICIFLNPNPYLVNLYILDLHHEEFIRVRIWIVYCLRINHVFTDRPQIVYRLLVPSGWYKYYREVPAASFEARIVNVGAVLGTLHQSVCQPILHGFLVYGFQRSTGDDTYMAL